MAYPERLLVAGERVVRHVRPHWRMLVVPALLPPVVAFVGAWLVAVARPTSWSTAVLVAVGVVAVGDRKSTRLNSSHSGESRMPSSA